MSRSCLITILILHYNRPKDISLCLESIRRNTPEPYEILLIDNGSPSLETKELLRSIPGITLIDFPQNIRMNTASAMAAALAKGEFIASLNDDIITTPGWIERFLKHFERNPQVGVIGPRSNFVSGPQLVREARYKDLKELDKFAQWWAMENEGRLSPYTRLVGFCTLIRREVVDKIGWADPRFRFGFDDDDFSLRINLAGFKTAIAQDVFIHHTGGPQMKGDPHHQRLLNEGWAEFKKKWDLPAEMVMGRYHPKALLNREFDSSRDYVPLPDRETAEKHVFRGSAGIVSGKAEADGSAFKRGLAAHYPKESHSSSSKALYPGLLAYILGDQRTAIDEFREAVVKHPGSASLHFALGVSHATAGQMELAVDPLSRAMELEPVSADIPNTLGTVLRQLGRNEQAEIAFKKADYVSLYGQEARLSLISLYCEQGRINEASEKAMEALHRAPDNTLVLAALADLCYRQGELGKAEICLERLLQLAPNDLRALLISCKIKVRQGEMEKAVRLLARIKALVEVRNDIEEMHLMLGSSHKAGMTSGTDSIIRWVSAMEDFLHRHASCQAGYSLASIIDEETIEKLYETARRLQAEGRKEQATALLNSMSKPNEPGNH